MQTLTSIKHKTALIHHTISSTINSVCIFELRFVDVHNSDSMDDGRIQISSANL